MSEETIPLIGDVTTQFVYRPDLTSYGTAFAAVKEDQEAMCGYPLRLSDQRQTEMVDAKGRLIEVFVTFAPAPAPPTMPRDATQV